MNYQVRYYGRDVEPKSQACRHPWPEGTKFLCANGAHRIEGKYVICYEFQAFYNGYIFKGRFGGRNGTEYTAQLAEREAWYCYELRKDKLCKHDHKDPENCEKRGYENGCGFCIHCGLFVMHVFDITTTCINCGDTTNWTRDINQDFWCETCCETMPEELQTDMQKQLHMEANHRRGVDKIKKKLEKVLGNVSSN